MAVTFSGWNNKITNHINNKNNPHGVTKEQVGAYGLITTLVGNGTKTILQYIKELQDQGIDGGTFNAVNVPDSPYDSIGWGCNINFYRGEKICVFLIKPFNNEIYYREAEYDASKWNTEWVKLFTTEGGILNGDLTIQKDDPSLVLKNNNNTTDGGCLTRDAAGYLRLQNKYNDKTYIELCFLTSGMPNIMATGIPDFLELIFGFNNSAHHFLIYGEHNKTSGSYTTTGKNLTINTHGRGKVVMVYNNNNNGIAFISKEGAYCMHTSGQIEWVSPKNADFSDDSTRNGILGITINHEIFNKPGATHYYIVL